MRMHPTHIYADRMVWFHGRRLPKDGPYRTFLFFSCVRSLTILSIFQFPSHHRQHQAIANHVEANNLQANPETKKKFNLFVGASVGPEVEDRWANMDM